MSRGLFVTGTDTGVGKTYVAAALLRALVADGQRVAVLKPAETGCVRQADGSLAPEDGLLLRKAAGLDALPIEEIVPHRYQAPLAPAVAARSEPPPFSLARTRAALDVLLAHRPNLIIIEGAGGLLVPYSDDLLGADLAAALGFPLVIVARAGLGTINHTLLTVNEARRRGLAVAGVILNQATASTNDPSVASNAAEISRIGHVRVLGSVAHGATPALNVDELLIGSPP